MAGATRRDFLKVLGAGAAWSVLSRRLRAEELAGRPPNFVVFLTDDMGYGDLGSYGHPLLRTPHLDRFAARGRRFTQCYSASPVCSPSRSAILTGRTPYRNGVFTWIDEGSPIHLRRSEVTVATLLRGAGYATCHVGKWHLNGKFNSREQPQPDDHGYEWWFATQNNADPSHENPRNFVRNGKAVGPLEGYSAPLVVDEAIGWLTKHRDRKKPFFLTVWTHEPHSRIATDPKFSGAYSAVQNRNQREHHGNITQIDHAFGRLMKALSDLGHSDDTLVFFTSDNGPEGQKQRGITHGSTAGLRGRKRSLHEGGIRVPGIAWWPGRIKGGTQSREPVIGTDLFPTLLELAGVPVPDDRRIDGASLVPALRGESVRRTVPMYWRFGGTKELQRIAMREGDLKILANRRLTRFELFDVAKDPGETRDLSGTSPAVLRRMRDRLTALNAEVEAEGPDWWKGHFGAEEDEVSTGDRTGTFDVVKRCAVTKSELGYRVESAKEGFALRRLSSPLRSRAELRVRYRSVAADGSQNAFLAFASRPNLDRLVKCGTAIGREVHAVFAGPWRRIEKGTLVPAKLTADRIFAARVSVDLRRRALTAVIDGARFTAKLPASLDAIEYVGYYVKETASEFSPIEIDGA